MHYQNRRTWAQDSLTTLAPRLLDGSTVGVIGLGAIGCEVARLASALGARVEGIRRRSDAPTPQGVSAVDTPDALARRLPSWDVLVLAAPQTPATFALIGR
jgi:phosphoglycerate dehydrogenase-like enzyme